MCPLVNELKTRKSINTVVCGTGQRHQMLDQILEAFDVTPDYDLSIMKEKQTLFDITTNVRNIIGAVFDKAKPDVVLVHEAAAQELGGCNGIHIVEPLEVLYFYSFLARSFMILADSGGNQKEAPSLGKPVLIMHDTTESPEGIAAGTRKLVGTDEQVIYDNFKLLLENEEAYDAMSKASNLYGDGLACKRIADILEKQKEVFET